MKSLIVLAAFVALASAQFQNFGRAQGGFQSFGSAGSRASAFGAGAAPKATAFVAAAPRASAFGAAAARPNAFVASAPRVAAVVARPAVAVASRVSSSDQAANILRNDVDINPDGTFSYGYETDNGISAQVQGSAFDARGSFSWTSPEGQPIGISFVADENGYQPSGDALPTPPPIPPQIARALEWLAVNARPQE